MTHREDKHGPRRPARSWRSPDRSLGLDATRGQRATGTDWGDVHDCASLDYTLEEGLLQIRISGPLDLRCAFVLQGLVQAIDDSVHGCILDLSGVDRVFDSGIAILLLAVGALQREGIEDIRIQGIDLDTALLRPFLM
jgi:ABC-type transporter Mla MlaB component